VTLAGQVGVAGHLTIGKGVVATAQTGIPNSVEPGSLISGYPAIANRDWLKASAIFRKLPELRKALAELERRVQELEKRENEAPPDGK
jgi:UDP-3-O-[3-hydroxymyristoyl] glucosamine N-acyltransferase